MTDIIHREKEALSTLDSLISNLPAYAIGHAQRGFVYTSIGSTELALQDFNRFIRIVTDQNQLSQMAAMVEDIIKDIEELT